MSHDPLSPPVYPMITYTYAAASNLPTKALVAKQQQKKIHCHSSTDSVKSSITSIPILLLFFLLPFNILAQLCLIPCDELNGAARVFKRMRLLRKRQETVCLNPRCA